MTYNDYYPYGMLMPNRHANSDRYRYGYQGSEKDDEVKGEGNSYTTLFRQLDVRLGKWLSIDPKGTAFESHYASMGNNPIWHNDVLGDTIRYAGENDACVKQAKRFIGMMKSSSNPYIRLFINLVEKNPHDIIINVEEGRGFAYTVPKAVEEHDLKIIKKTAKMQENDFNLSEEEYEKLLDKIQEVFEQGKLNRPTKHREPGGDDAIIIMPYFNSYYKRSKEEKEFFKHSSPHELYAHELFHALRIALGLVTANKNGENNRALEEVLATQMVNILYKSKETRIKEYDFLE